MANLESRIRPLNKKLTNWVLGEYHGLNSLEIRTPGNYLGVHDGFPDRINGDYSDRKYYLWLDREHEKYDYWNGSLEIEGDSFAFKPTPEFVVEGQVVDSGTVNDFDYYFVDVTKKPH
jgi:hypothetical protein